MPKKDSPYVTLKQLFESNKKGGTFDQMTEMPHWDFQATKSPLHGDDRVYSHIDFRTERYTHMSREQKADLVGAFLTTGFVAPTKHGHLFLSSGAKGQPELARATPQQIKELPHLPDDWEKYALFVD